MRNLLVALFLLVTTLIQAQNPVKWDTSVEKVSDSEYELVIKATIEEHWHLYAQNQPLGEEASIIPTTFSFKDAGGNYELIEDVEEEEPITELDQIFGEELSYFAEEVTFKQRVKITNPTVNSIVGSVEYQACDDQRCIFNDADLGFSLDGSKVDFGTKEVDSKSINLAEDLALPLKNTDLLKDVHGSDVSKERDLSSLFIL